MRFDWAIRPLVVVLVFAVVACQGCDRSSGSAATRTVRIALTRDAITWLPVHLAQSLGYIEQEGLTLAVSDLGGMSRAAEALLGGSVDVACGNPTMALQLRAEGRDVRAFIMMASRPNAAIVATPQSGIRRIADLKGRRVGISSPGSPTQFLVNYVLKANGLSPDDVTIVTIGAGATSVAALEHNRVDAGSLVGAAITTVQKRLPGLTILADSRSPEGAQAFFGSPTLPSSSLLAESRWLRENADTAQRLVRAIKKAMTWIRAHSADEAFAQMPEAIRMADPDADVESIRITQSALSPDGMMQLDGLEAVRKVLAASNDKVGAIDLSTIYTNEFAAEK